MCSLMSAILQLYKQMSEVFDNPEDVMLKFLQRVFDKIIYVSDKYCKNYMQ